MADSLDRIVVQVVADVDGAQAKITQYADANEKALAKVEAASTRAGASQQILQHVIRSTSDALAAGAPLSQVFGQQVGRLGEAVELSGNTFGSFGKYLAGGWGIAIGVGVSVLIPLITKILEARDSTDALVAKMQEDERNTEDLNTAKERFGNTLEGVTKALRDQKDALDKVDDAEKTAAERANIAAQQELERTKRIRETTVALLAQAEADFQVAQGQSFGAAGGAGAGMATSIYADRLSEVQRLKDKAEADLSIATSNFDRSRVDLAVEDGKRNADPRASIDKRFNDEIAAAGQKADAAIAAARKLGKNTTELSNALIRETQAIEERRRVALKTYDDSQRKPHTTDQIGRTINEAQARAIVESIGGTVTSGARSYDKQAQLYARYKAGNGPLAAAPGTSLHEAGLAVDVAKSAGVTLAKLKAAFEKQGVRVTELLDEGDHFHVGFGKDKGAADAKRAAAEKKRAADEAVRNQRDFETQRDQLNQELLRALGSQTQDAGTLAQLALDQITVETKAKLARIDAEEKLGKLTKAQADEERALVQSIDHANRANIAAAMAERLAKQKLDLAESDLRNQEDVLGAQLDLADTTKQRHAIEQRLLDLKFEELRLQEQANLDAAIRNKDDAAAKIARERLATLPQLQGAAQQSLDRKYETPGQQYVRSLNAASDEIGNSVQTAAVNGLQSLNDQLADAIVNSKSLGDVFHNVAKQIVADLLRIAIQQAVIKPLAHALFGGDDSGSQGGGFGALFASIFGGGHQSASLGSDPLGIGGGNSSLIASLVSGFAQGGSMTLGGRSGVDQNLLSLNGQPLARVSAGETLNVSPKARASSGGGLTVIAPQQFDLSGVVMTEDMFALLDQRNREYANHVATQAGRAAVKAAPAQVARTQRFGT